MATTEGTQSIRRALAVLRLIANHQGEGLRFVDVVERSGFQRSTVHRLLRCLVQEQYAHKDFETRRYQLGVESLQLGLSATHKTPLVDSCHTTLRRLARLTGDTVFLLIRHGDFAVCLARVEGPVASKSPRTGIGESRLLGVGPAGLALLAALPNDEIDDLLTRHHAEYTRIGHPPARLKRAVEMTRRAGFSETQNSITFGVSGVGAAFPLSTTAFAALSIAGETNRMNRPRCRALGETLIREAQILGKAFSRRGRLR